MLVNLKSWVIFLVWYSLNGYARSCGWLDRCVNLEEIVAPISISFDRNLNLIWERKTNQRAPELSLNRFSRKYRSISFSKIAVIIEIFRKYRKNRRKPVTQVDKVGLFLLFLDGKRSSTNMQLFLKITCGYWYTRHCATRLQKNVAALRS